ncbi:hypothetical protein NPIL_665441 [Nephila pilipes]|uniref:Uncharacterized protein n=1 Tax=Nephila pilipes TaxID=299642 RepID=A0A8X6TJK7_NEPPI|nr:hypothetical protein NPIL_665441 [Nephila pilipes]
MANQGTRKLDLRVKTLDKATTLRANQIMRTQGVHQTHGNSQFSLSGRQLNHDARDSLRITSFLHSDPSPVFTTFKDNWQYVLGRQPEKTQ